MNTVNITVRWLKPFLIVFMMAAIIIFADNKSGATDLTVCNSCTYKTIESAIAAASPGDTVLLAGGATFNENINITKDLTLQGGYAGCPDCIRARSTINGGGTGSVVTVSSDLVTLLSNLILTNGNSYMEGGGILMSYGSGGGTMSLINVDIHGNTSQWGGGLWVGLDASVIMEKVNIYNNTASAFGGGVRLYGGNITLIDSNIYNNAAPKGAGVYATLESGSALSLHMTSNSSIYQNNAVTGDGQGGGIYMSQGEISMTDSSQIYSNNSSSSGGGVYLDNGSLLVRNGSIHDNATSVSLSGNYGGGIFATGNSSVDLRQTLIQGNRARNGGGIYANQSNIVLYNVFVTGNNAFISNTGDGVRLINGASLTGSHNTFAHNDNELATTGRAIDVDDSSIITLSNSIIWGHSISINDSGHNVTCSDIERGYTGTGNIDMNPQFVNPADSDFRVQAISPVIDRCATGEVLDFEKEPRPIVHVHESTPYDMGADEFSIPRVGINGGACVYGTLTTAISAAEDGDTIQMAEGTYYEAIKIMDKDIIIAGGYDSTCAMPGSNNSTVNAIYHSGSVFNILRSTVTLRNLEITRGNAVEGGGVKVDTGSDVTLDNSHILLNTGSHGAGLYVNFNSITTLINGASIEYNTATVAGGGAYLSGQLVVNTWLGGINYNSAPNGGGVSILQGGSLLLDPGHVKYNAATAANGCGGGINILTGGVSAIKSSSNVLRNTAYNGAAICMDNSHVYLDNAHIHNNEASNNGGAVYMTNDSFLNSSYGYLFQNISGSNGGAVFLNGNSYLSLSRSIWYDNHSDGYGGAIYSNEGTIDINYSKFFNNMANRGGAIFQTGAAPSADVSNSLFYSNTSTSGFGGGIRSEGGLFSMTHVTLTENINGAGYSQVNTNGNVINSIAWGNDGGGFWKSTGSLDGTCNIDQSGVVGQNIDPMFVAPGVTRDYHLRSDSPAIDACATGLAYDLDEVPRPMLNSYDMGAYEYYIVYNVATAASPSEGGTVSGSGTYYSGANEAVEKPFFREIYAPRVWQP